jgi:hypothetical protein
MAAPMITVPMKNMTPIPQDTATTCWLACFRMLYNWLDRDEASIREKLTGAGILWDEACKNGLKTNDYMVAARALNLAAYSTSNSWDASNFKQFLAVGPVWVAGRWMDGMSHNVVVIGASDTRIKYIDPWWEGYKEANITERDAKWFISGNGKTTPGTDFYMGWMGAVQGCALVW